MRRGFSLVELLIVLAILVALVTAIVPFLDNVLVKGKAMSIVMDARAIKSAVHAYFFDTGDFPKAGLDFYDPGTEDDRGFKYFIEDDGSGKWNGPYLSALPENTPWNTTFRYWKSYITGTVYDAGGNPHTVNNLKCAVLTIGGFDDAGTRDKVDERIRKYIGWSYVGYSDTDKYYISVILWTEND